MAFPQKCSPREEGRSARTSGAGKIITDGGTPPEGVKIPHADFTVVVTSWFKVSDLEDFFFAEGMGFATVGKDKFQVIEIEHEEGTEMME